MSLLIYGTAEKWLVKEDRGRDRDAAIKGSLFKDAAKTHHNAAWRIKNSNAADCLLDELTQIKDQHHDPENPMMTEARTKGSTAALLRFLEYQGELLRKMRKDIEEPVFKEHLDYVKKDFAAGMENITPQRAAELDEENGNLKKFLVAHQKKNRRLERRYGF